MVKQTDGKLTPMSIFPIVIVLVMNLLSVVACSNGSPTQNPTTSPQPPNPNHLQNSYPAPNWWKPCISSNVITVSINGVNRPVCTAWDQSQSATQCDSINYQMFTGTAAIPLTSWRGIDVCGPRPNDTPNYPDHYTEFSTGGSVEQEFECTELVKRYLYLAYGLPSLGGTDGAQVVDNYTAKYSSLHKVVNDGTVQMFPTEGDVLSFSGQNITHTGIVTGLTDVNNNGMGSATIHIIEQNWTDTSGARTLSMNNWMIGGSVISWMTTRPVSAQSSPTNTPTPTQRTLTSQQTQSKTVNATGQRTTPGTHATGVLTFSEPYINTGPFTFNAGTVFNDDAGNRPNVQMMIDATITVPTEGNGSVTVPAHVVQIGTIGNIPIHGWTHYFNHSDAEPVDIYNSTPFTGGTDTQSYATVQQSDIDTAANALKTSTRQSAVADLNSQLQPNEHLVSDPQCTYNVTSDHAAGDQAATVKVTVMTTCTATAST